MRGKILISCLFLACASAAHAELIRVDPAGPVKTLADAAKQARAGDIVQLPPGQLHGDVAVWTQASLTIRGAVEGTTLFADGRSAEDKAIFVVRGGNIVIENITFTGARVSARNGAGIRFEAGALTVRNCRFIDNENGILTANTPTSSLVIENSEFAFNGAGDGQSHNLYVGAIGRLEVTGSWFHQARVGHLLKSRARENIISYNRLTDEANGHASYELEFPNGGRATVIGNLIEQSPTTENPNLISFGAEGFKSDDNRLLLAYNTLVDDRPSEGNFLKVWPGNTRVVAINNVLVGGRGTLDAGPGATVSNNVAVVRDAFADTTDYDYRLRASAATKLKAPLPDDVELAPLYEYVHPLKVRALAGPPRLPGAFQSVVP